MTPRQLVELLTWEGMSPDQITTQVQKAYPDRSYTREWVDEVMDDLEERNNSYEY
jgi:hypothetical protein